jgi:soluble lytic murein transglycosylase-like protein
MGSKQHCFDINYKIKTMKIRGLILFTTLILSIIIITMSFKIMNNKVEKNPSIELSKLGNSNLSSPTPLKMYELIEYYSDIYEIPKYIAFNVAYLETKYKGPFDWKYKPSQTSPVGAVGPMQIMSSTANGVHNQKISKNNLKNDIELNIRTSMMLLHQLHNRYGNWGLVCGYYNTGRPIINGYASFCINNKNYQKNWVYIRGV